MCHYSWLGIVLILVLVEDGLGANSEPAKPTKANSVLILVLVEDGLGVCMVLTTGGRAYMS